MAESNSWILTVLLPALVALVAALLRRRKEEPEAAPEPGSPADLRPAQPQPVAVPPEHRDIAARTVFGEARGEPRLGQIAVAWVIRNRAERPRWWGRTVLDVCLRKAQFSCWWDKQAPRLRSADLSRDPRFTAIRAIVDDVFDGRIPDPTGGADHYCTTEVAPRTSWAKDRKPTVVIGAHSFYRLES